MALFNKRLSCVYGSVIPYVKNRKLLFGGYHCCDKDPLNQCEFVLSTCLSELHDTYGPGKRILISTNREIVTKAKVMQHVASFQET